MLFHYSKTFYPPEFFFKKFGMFQQDFYFFFISRSLFRKKKRISKNCSAKHGSICPRFLTLLYSVVSVCNITISNNKSLVTKIVSNFNSSLDSLPLRWHF